MPMSKEFFKKEFEIDLEKSESNDDYYKISGVASSYGNVDSWGDIFKEGSLDEEIGKTVPLKVDHERDLKSIVGKATFKKLGKLIKFEGELIKGDPLAEKIALMKSMGIPLKTSIGGGIISSKWIKKDNKDYRVIEKGIIRELSVVTSGANPLAIVEKSEDNNKNNNNMEVKQMDKELLELLKNLGVKIDGIEKAQKEGMDKEVLKKEVMKDLEEYKKSLEKEKNEEIAELKKAISEMDKLIKSNQFIEAKNVVKDFNYEFKKSVIAKNERDFIEMYGERVVAEYKKENTAYADVSAIIEVPILDDIIKSIGEISPLFADSGKISFKGESATIPVRKKQPNNVKDVSLYQGTTGTKVEYEFKVLSKGVMQTEYKVADELVADTKFDIMSDLYEAASDDFAETIAERILKGTVDTTKYQGNKFEGIQINEKFKADRVVEQKTAGTLDWKEIQAMIRKIPAGKRNGMVFYCSPEACDIMETMVDGNNRPLWRDSLTTGSPSTFLGYPVKEVYNMGKDTGDMMILFANMNGLYKIGLDYEMRLETERKASERATNTVINSRMGGIVRDIECGYAIAKKANMRTKTGTTTNKDNDLL